ncbi:MAG: thiamine-phosphate kinase [halophilic archaeon J07HX64]|jgi:thiamine-phosphate kinase|nr:MAG: thiamine-phosphate kinase [halophilic archaeon J07HX64]
MDERAALAVLAGQVPAAGDDAAVVDGHVLTTDMLHDRTDFPAGTSSYTAGWRAVGASLSDVAAMGADPVGVVAAYGAPSFAGVESFVEGAQTVCERVDTAYVGGDLDSHEELTVATTALGRTDRPVRRSDAQPGDAVCVTGTLGRSGAACRLFAVGETERANALFRFEPRIDAGQTLATHATAMMDSSDGLARSLHQLAAASDCGIAAESPLPVDDAVESVAADGTERRELGVFFGEDFELVCTLPPDRVSEAREETTVPLSRIGIVTGTGVSLDGDPLPDRGYTHDG